MSEAVAPRAFITEISLILSIIFEYIVFITLIPPTKRAIDDTNPIIKFRTPNILSNCSIACFGDVIETFFSSSLGFNFFSILFCIKSASVSSSRLTLITVNSSFFKSANFRTSSIFIIIELSKNKSPFSLPIPITLKLFPSIFKLVPTVTDLSLNPSLATLYPKYTTPVSEDFKTLPSVASVFSSA